MSETKNKLQVRLITPQGVEFDKAIAMAVVPGSEGVFCALPSHAPFVAFLKQGVVQLYFDDRHQSSPDQAIEIKGGFAELTPELCTILADHN